MSGGGTVNWAMMTFAYWLRIQSFILCSFLFCVVGLCVMMVVMCVDSGQFSLLASMRHFSLSVHMWYGTLGIISLVLRLKAGLSSLPKTNIIMFNSPSANWWLYKIALLFKFLCDIL
jgi:hypothetical protein